LGLTTIIMALFEITKRLTVYDFLFVFLVTTG